MDSLDETCALVTEFVLLGFQLVWTTDCPVSPVSDFVLYAFNREHWIDDDNQGWSAPSNPHVFFLSNLSFVDICYSSVITLPKRLCFCLRTTQFPVMAVPCSSLSSVLLQIPNPLSWLPWCMTATLPSVTLYCTQLWCLGASAYGWSSCHTLEAIGVPWCTHPFAFILKYCDKNVINHFLWPPSPAYRTQTRLEWLLSYGISVEIICFIVVIILLYVLLSVLKICSSSGEGPSLPVLLSPDIRGHLPGNSALPLLMTQLPVFSQHW